jgi:hypothetical protein
MQIVLTHVLNKDVTEIHKSQDCYCFQLKSTSTFKMNMLRVLNPTAAQYQYIFK